MLATSSPPRALRGCASVGGGRATASIVGGGRRERRRLPSAVDEGAARALPPLLLRGRARALRGAAGAGAHRAGGRPRPLPRGRLLAPRCTTTGDVCRVATGSTAPCLRCEQTANRRGARRGARVLRARSSGDLDAKGAPKNSGAKSEEVAALVRAAAAPLTAGGSTAMHCRRLDQDRPRQRAGSSLATSSSSTAATPSRSRPPTSPTSRRTRRRRTSSCLTTRRAPTSQRASRTWWCAGPNKRVGQRDFGQRPRRIGGAPGHRGAAPNGPKARASRSGGTRSRAGSGVDGREGSCVVLCIMCCVCVNAYPARAPPQCCPQNHSSSSGTASSGYFRQ